MLKIKICGQTRAEDIRLSFDSGADLCGVVVEVASSPRSMALKDAVPLFEEFGKKLVALTADAPRELYSRIAKELKPTAIQLTANETFETVAELKDSLGIPLFKSLHLPQKGSGAGDTAEKFCGLMEKYSAVGVTVFVLDTRVEGMYGGSGKSSDWDLAGKILENTKVDTFLAGGITPANAAMAASLNPYGIDLASGVEERPGVKSAEKIGALFKALEVVKT